MKGIPYQRLLIYGAILSLLPAIVVSVYLYRANSQLEVLQGELEYTYSEVMRLAEQQAPNRAIRAQYAKANEYFLDQQLESLSLLEREQSMLRETLKTQGEVAQEALERRLKFLEEQNRLSFSEGNIEKYAGIQESEASLQNRVEVDVFDVKRLLAIIEGLPVEGVTPPPNPPQLIILEFSLEEQRGLGDNETYSLGLKLLKREFKSTP